MTPEIAYYLLTAAARQARSQILPVLERKCVRTATQMLARHQFEILNQNCPAKAR